MAYSWWINPSFIQQVMLIRPKHIKKCSQLQILWLGWWQRLRSRSHHPLSSRDHHRIQHPPSRSLRNSLCPLPMPARRKCLSCTHTSLPTALFPYHGPHMTKGTVTIDDITWLVPHQANKRIIDATSNRMGLDNEKVMMNIQKYGNTTSGTLPLLLWDYEKQLKKGDNLVFAAFGGGFTWGSIYLKWAY